MSHIGFLSLGKKGFIRKKGSSSRNKFLSQVPTKHEYFDEASSETKQMVTLRDYQRFFKQLANHVACRTQKALIDTFLGGLEDKIIIKVRMFKPKTLRETLPYL